MHVDAVGIGITLVACALNEAHEEYVNNYGRVSNGNILRERKTSPNELGSHAQPPLTTFLLRST